MRKLLLAIPAILVLSGTAFAAGISCGQGPDGEATTTIYNFQSGRLDCITQTSSNTIIAGTNVTISYSTTTGIYTVSSTGSGNGSTFYNSTATAGFPFGFSASTATFTTFGTGVVKSDSSGRLSSGQLSFNGPLSVGTGTFSSYTNVQSTPTTGLVLNGRDFNSVGSGANNFIAFSTETGVTPGYYAVVSATVDATGRVTGISYSTATSSGGGITPGASYYVQVTNSLQAGATFFVSSGTIQGGSFNVNNVSAMSYTNISSVTVSASTSSPFIMTYATAPGGAFYHYIDSNVVTGIAYLSTSPVQGTGQGVAGWFLESTGPGNPINWTQLIPSSFSAINVATATTALSYVSTGLKAQITPRFAGCRIKITVSGMAAASGAVGVKCQMNVSNSGVTALANGPLGSATDAVLGISGVNGVGFTWYDSPNTTSATAYTALMRTSGTTPTCTFCSDGANGTCSILVEDVGP